MAMFLDFYRLRENPFGTTPDPRFYYPSGSHREALASLTYAIECRLGFAAIVAEPGMGKTMLLRRLLHDFEARAQTAFLLDTDTCTDPLPAILAEFGISTHESDRMTACARFKEMVVSETRRGHFALLIIDEAQNLDSGGLESIRLLSNFESDETKLLQIVLGGQPRLAEKLCAANLRQLYQRIPVGGSLERLDRIETELYMAHRLCVAGYKGPQLFTTEAVDMIARESGGIPRQINSLCFRALSLACALKKAKADREVVREVLHDFRWAQRIAAQQVAAARAEMSCSEAASAAPTMAWQAHRGSIVKPAAGTQGRATSFDDGQLAGQARPTAGRAPAIATVANLRKPEDAVPQPPPQATQPAPARVRARTAAAGQVAPRPHSGLVTFAAALVVLIIALFSKRTDSGKAFVDWTAAQIKAAFSTENSKPAAAEANTGQQQHSVTRTRAGQRDSQPAPAVPKSSRPASNVAVGGDRETASTPGLEKAGVIDDFVDDGTEVVVRHPPKPAPSQSAHTTHVIIEPDTALAAPARPSAEGVEIRSGSSVFGAELRGVGPATAAGGGSPRISTGTTPAVPMSRFVPAYPEVARRWNMEGTVSLEAVVDTQGHVRQVKTLSGPQLLADAAAKAVRHWRYQPAMLNGASVESTVQVSIRFQLSRPN